MYSILVWYLWPDWACSLATCTAYIANSLEDKVLLIDHGASIKPMNPWPEWIHHGFMHRDPDRSRITEPDPDNKNTHTSGRKKWKCHMLCRMLYGFGGQQKLRRCYVAKCKGKVSFFCFYGNPLFAVFTNHVRLCISFSGIGFQRRVVEVVSVMSSVNFFP